MYPSIDYLHSLGYSRKSEEMQAMIEFESILQKCQLAVLEEAVPAEMMEVFTDEQWLDLLFEFQPGTATMTANWDVPAFHAAFSAGTKPTPESCQLPSACNWLVARDKSELVVRIMKAPEYKAFTNFTQGAVFADVAKSVWPEKKPDDQLSAMTEQIIVWLDEKLIIDAGVPLPDDAEFEQEFLVSK